MQNYEQITVENKRLCGLTSVQSSLALVGETAHFTGNRCRDQVVEKGYPKVDTHSTSRRSSKVRCTFSVKRYTSCRSAGHPTGYTRVNIELHWTMWRRRATDVEEKSAVKRKNFLCARSSIIRSSQEVDEYHRTDPYSRRTSSFTT